MMAKKPTRKKLVLMRATKTVSMIIRTCNEEEDNQDGRKDDYQDMDKETRL